MTDGKPVYDVVIVGGSLTGLLHGIVQKNLGCSVLILESSLDNERDLQAAGIGCQEEIVQIFKKYGMSMDDLGIFADHVDGYVPESSNSELIPSFKFPYNAVLTAWNVMYHRLRADLGGWVPQGTEYRSATKVTGLHYDKHTEQVTVEYHNLKSSTPNQIHTLLTSLVIAADGSNSTIRKQLLPNMPERKYSGYILWRGTYPLRDTSEVSTALINHGPAFYMLPRLKNYSVIYQNPPDNGSPDPNDRLVNFAWYDWCPANSPLYKLARTATTGYQHHLNVPRGQLNPAAWSHQVIRARNIMHPAASDMVSSCAIDPFVTFFDDHVVLSGEALAVARPHSGAALNESARQARM